MRAMTAKFDGKCKGCGVRVRKGDRILWGRSEGTYHAGCQPLADPAAAAEYQQGRADADRYMANREIYGAELADAWELEAELRDG